jgi:threonyl-tRNA synthetase
LDPASYLHFPLLAQVYDVFGLQYRMALSTRPEKYMGSLELWAKAEASLEDALNASGQQWEVPF